MIFDLVSKTLLFIFWHFIYLFDDLVFQAQPIDPDLTAKLLGRGVAVSPVVTVEPRRRKFHKAITLSIPTPRAHSQGMINQYSGNAPTLRLLCSITGERNDLNFLFFKLNWIQTSTVEYILRFGFDFVWTFFINKNIKQIVWKRVMNHIFTILFLSLLYYFV